MTARAWQTPALLYYLAEHKSSPGDVPAPDRPTEEHEWQDGVGWALPTDVEDRRAALEVDALPPRVLFELNFNQENRIRALESRPAITRAQYRAALIALVKQLNQGG